MRTTEEPTEDLNRGPTEDLTEDLQLSKRRRTEVADGSQSPVSCLSPILSPTTIHTLGRIFIRLWATVLLFLAFSLHHSLRDSQLFSVNTRVEHICDSQFGKFEPETVPCPDNGHYTLYESIRGEDTGQSHYTLYRPIRRGDAYDFPARVYGPIRGEDTGQAHYTLYRPIRRGDAYDFPARVYGPIRGEDTGQSHYTLYRPIRRGDAYDFPARVYGPIRGEDTGQAHYTLYRPIRRGDAYDFPARVYGPIRGGDTECRTEDLTELSLRMALSLAPSCHALLN
uniref:Uncharacterized protein n=1 Tax=Knipowitschia caucasica TaxID=637954 RepID=A0AAV2K8M8_KNICA